VIRFRPALLLAVALVVSSCSAIQNELPIPAATTSFATAEAAFNILIERHVDKPGSPQLLNAALDAVQTLLEKMADPSPTVTKPTFTGNPQSDFAKFASTLTDVLKANPKEDPTLVEEQATDGMARSMNECHTYYLDPARAIERRAERRRDEDAAIAPVHLFRRREDRRHRLAAFRPQQICRSWQRPGRTGPGSRGSASKSARRSGPSSERDPS